MTEDVQYGKTVVVVGDERPKEDVTYRAELDLTLAGKSVDEAFVEAQKVILEYFRRKENVDALPEDMLKGKSCEVPCELNKFFTVAIQETSLWAVYYSHPCIGIADTFPAVNNRTWHLDAALVKRDTSVSFAIQTACTTWGSSIRALVPYIRNGLINELLRNGFCLSHLGMPISNTCIFVQPNEVDAWLEVLRSPERKIPLFVMSTLQYLDNLKEDAEAQRFSTAFVSYAFVLVFPPQTARRWTEALGRDYGVFNGAVRVYYPGFNKKTDEPFKHPLTMHEKIDAFHYDDRIKRELRYGYPAFRSFVGEKFKVQNPGLIREFSPDVMFARSAKLEEQKINLEKLKTIEVAEEFKLIKDIMEGQIQELDDELGALKQSNKRELFDAQILAEDYRKTVQDLRGQLCHLNERLRSLRAALRKPGDPEPTFRWMWINKPENQQKSLAEKYANMIEWIEESLSDTLILASRAKRCLKDARYENPKLVGRCLEVLATQYYQSKTSGKTSRENNNLTSIWQGINVECEWSISKEQTGMFGQEYYIADPFGTDEKKLLDWHLKYGTQKDDAKCMRIYFYWDSVNAKVVVGSLPAHLTTSSS